MSISLFFFFGDSHIPTHRNATRAQAAAAAKIDQHHHLPA
jgi:hypothetical protein